MFSSNNRSGSSTEDPCLLCIDLDFGPNGWGAGRGNYDMVCSFARRRCAGCDIIARILTAFRERHNDMDEVADSRQLYKKGTSTYLRLRVYYRTEYLELFTTTEKTCPWPQIPSIVPVPQNTASEMAFSVLRSWIQECSLSHKQCQRYLQTTYLPTRVVEILSSRSVRLQETYNQDGLYTCLSHCWGAQLVIRTIIASLAAHQASIPWTALPKTLQDAIDITSHLGIKYIWTDSLCIVQDDHNDWRHEGSKMCDIYSNCYLTIAAAKSKDSSGGCYVTAGSKDDMEHWFANADDSLYDISIRRRIWHIDDEDDIDCDISNLFPLTTRAWVFQERLLSARVVHFGSVELSWECRQGSVCQCSNWRYGLRQSTKSLRPLISTSVAASQQKVWRQVVQEYSLKNLSDEADIFPALQGVAKLLSREKNCHAGLWNTDKILTDLLWSAWEGVSPEAWRAPTWSWASVKGHIIFPSGNETTRLASVESIESEPLGYNFFGQVTSGRLKLRGLCIEARIKSGATSTGWLISGPDLGFILYYCDLNAYREKKTKQVEGQGLGVFLPDRKDEHFKSQNVEIMPSLCLENDQENDNPFQDIPTYSLVRTIFLVLSCVDPKEHIYRRIGLLIAEKQVSRAYLGWRWTRKRQFAGKILTIV